MNRTRQRSPLGELLAAGPPPPTPLGPVHATNSFVGDRTPLPPDARYGPMHPVQAAGAGFTGARVTNPITSPVHPEPPPVYSPPVFSGSEPARGVAPTLAALGLLTGAAHGGLPTPTLPQPAAPIGQGTGAVPSRPPVPPPGTGIIRNPDVTRTVAPSSPGLGAELTDIRRGGGVFSTQPQKEIAQPGSAPVAGVPSPLLTALLAAAGTKANPSRGTFLL